MLRCLTILLILIPFIALKARAATAASSPRPNIVFIIVDDQKRDQFNHLPEGRTPEGLPRNLTPELDRLSREGFVLRNHHTPTPICVPSRFAALTGRYPSRATNPEMVHGWFKPAIEDKTRNVFQSAHIMPDTPNLARDLRDLGYRTGAVGKNHVIQETGPYRALPHDADPRDPAVQAALVRNHRIMQESYHTAGFDFADRLYHGNLSAYTLPTALVHHNLDWIAEGALEFLDADDEQPFFLYFATTVPHKPFDDGTAWKQSDPLATSIGFLDSAPTALAPRESIGSRLREAGLADDRGDPLWLDDCIAALKQKLSDQGRLENTIFIYYNDHGMEGAKFTLYEKGMQTPCIFWGPRWIHPGGSTNELTSTVDIAATLLDLAGDEHAAEEMDGVSLTSLLATGEGHPRSFLYGEFGYARTIRHGPWKYIAVRIPAEMKSLPQRQARIDAQNRRRANVGQPPLELDPTGPMLWNGHLASFKQTQITEGQATSNNYYVESNTDDYPGYFDDDQLYNLNSDPDEQHNVAADPANATILADLRAELNRLMQTLPGGFPTL